MANMNIKSLKSNVLDAQNADEIGIARIQLLDEKTGTPIQDMDVISDSKYIGYTNFTPVINNAAKKSPIYPDGTTFDNVSVKSVLDSIIYNDVSSKINYVRIGNNDYNEDLSDSITILKEKSTIVESFNITVYFIAGSTTLKSCTVYGYEGDNKVLEKSIDTNISAGLEGHVEFTIPALSKNTKYTFELKDSSTRKSNISVSYEFVDPVFMGYCTEDILGDGSLNNTGELNSYFNELIEHNSNLIKKEIKETKSIINSINLPYENTKLFPFVLYPKTWKNLQSIKDYNGFDIIDAYSSNSYLSINTNSSDIALKDYICYISRNGFKNKHNALGNISYIF